MKVFSIEFYRVKYYLFLMNKQIGILAVLAGVLLSGALLATPSLRVANAQGNETAQIRTRERDYPSMHGLRP